PKPPPPICCEWTGRSRLTSPYVALVAGSAHVREQAARVEGARNRLGDVVGRIGDRDVRVGHLRGFLPLAVRARERAWRRWRRKRQRGRRVAVLARAEGTRSADRARDGRLVRGARVAAALVDADVGGGRIGVGRICDQVVGAETGLLER